MKKILFLITICASFMMYSCTEDSFLDEDPKDEIFADNLYVDYDGFQNGLNGLYQLVRRDRGSESNTTRGALWQVGTDNCFSNNYNTKLNAFNNYDDLDADNGFVEDDFNWLYKIINAANTIINRAEDSSVDWMGANDEYDELNKNKVVAQARLIRAWSYRHLKYGWGAVPLSLEEITGSNYSNAWTRTPVDSINIQMEKDLLFAKNNLDIIEETGEVNSAVASTMLSELYLEEERYEEAADEAISVIDNGQYSLMTERFGSNASEEGCVFSDLFKNPTPELGNKEVLWVLNNAYSDITGSYGLYMKNSWNCHYDKDKVLKKVNDLDTLFYFNGGKGSERLAITPDAFDWYEPDDDRFSEYCIKKYYIYPTDGTLETFDTIQYTSDEYDDLDDLEDNHLWPWPRKWEYVDNYVFANNSSAASYDDQMFMRLGETYLLAAEALMKQGLTDEAAIYLNALRERSNASEISGSDVDMDFILDERSRELVSEEYRRHTLVRTGTFYERTLKYNPLVTEDEITEDNALLPIPQGIIDANTDNVMEQNPGY